MHIQRCTGEGQGECRKCKMDGIWNRRWMSFLYEIEGMPGVYCWDCVKKIAKEQEGPNIFKALEGVSNEINQ